MSWPSQTTLKSIGKNTYQPNAEALVIASQYRNARAGMTPPTDLSARRGGMPSETSWKNWARGVSGEIGACMGSNSSSAGVFGRYGSVLLSLSARAPGIPGQTTFGSQTTAGGKRRHGRESVTFLERKLEQGPRGAPCPDPRSRCQRSPCRQCE